MAISFRPIEMVTSNGKWYGDFFAEALLVQFYVFYVLRFLFTYSGYGLGIGVVCCTLSVPMPINIRTMIFK